MAQPRFLCIGDMEGGSERTVRSKASDSRTCCPSSGNRVGQPVVPPNAGLVSRRLSSAVARAKCFDGELPSCSRVMRRFLKAPCDPSIPEKGRCFREIRQCYGRSLEIRSVRVGHRGRSAGGVFEADWTFAFCPTERRAPQAQRNCNSAFPQPHYSLCGATNSSSGAQKCLKQNTEPHADVTD